MNLLKKYLYQFSFLRKISKINVLHEHFLKTLYLWISKGLGPIEYHAYNLHKKGRWHLKNFYISNKTVTYEIRKKLNNKKWIPLLENKLFFFYVLKHFDIPTIPVFHFYHTKSPSFSNPSYLKNLFKKENIKNLVIKPVSGLGGKSIMVFNKILLEKNRYITTNNKVFTIEDIVSFMNKDLKRQRKEDLFEGFIMEKIIFQHPFFKVMNTGSINSIRLSTFVDREENVFVDFAMWRIGRKGSITDNLHSGGYVINIDIHSGELDKKNILSYINKGPWVQDAKKDVLPSLEKRDKIPYWDKILSLVKHAALTFKEIPSVGWDIAVTPDGPILIEGNENWDMVIAQALQGPYLSTKRKEILDSLNLNF